MRAHMDVDNCKSQREEGKKEKKKAWLMLINVSHRV